MTQFFAVALRMVMKVFRALRLGVARTMILGIVGAGTGLALVGCLGDGQIGGAGPDGGLPAGGPDAGSVGDGSSLAATGAELYAAKGCAGCHGPLATSDKRNASFARVRAAAGPDSQIAPMRSIRLTDDEVRALVATLADPGSPGGTDGRRPLAKPLLLTRTEVASRLYSIFRAVDGVSVDDEAVSERIAQYVADERNAAFFGGHCNRYDDCGSAGISASQSPATSTVRAGLLIRVCHDLLETPGVDRVVLAKAGLDLSSAVDASNVRSLWDVFAPGRLLSDASAAAVVAAAPADPAAGWSTVLRLFCRPTVLEAI